MMQSSGCTKPPPTHPPPREALREDIQRNPGGPPESPLLAAARRALGQSTYPQLRRLEVSSHEGLLVLRGRVPSYHLKQLAQVVVMAVPGFPGLRNELQVVRVH